MMRHIFAERRLLTSFRNRTVACCNRSSINEKNVFMTQIDLEFGSNGTIGLKTVVALNPVMAVRGLEAYLEQLAPVKDKLAAHLKTVEEYIRLFDETIDWVNNPERRFNLVTTLGYNPLIIHGTYSDRDVKIEVFGRNIFNLNLGFEVGTPGQLAYGVQRLNDLRDCLVEYRDAFAAIEIEQYINKH